MQRTEADLWRAFDVQRRALDISALAYDDDEVGEAARLAASVHILLGPKGRNHTSVVEQLGQWATLKLPSSVPAEQPTRTPLIIAKAVKLRDDEWLVMTEPAGRSAALGRDLTLTEWWSEVVLRSDAFELNRQQLVRILRDKDGGAHFDANVTDPMTVAALKGEITGFFADFGEGGRKPIPFALENTMRQIAEEVRLRLKFYRYGNDPTQTWTPHSPASLGQ